MRGRVITLFVSVALFVNAAPIPLGNVSARHSMIILNCD